MAPRSRNELLRKNNRRLNNEAIAIEIYRSDRATLESRGNFDEQRNKPEDKASNQAGLVPCLREVPTNKIELNN